MSSPIDKIDDLCLEEILAHDLNRDDLQRLTDIAGRIESDPALAKRLDELNALRLRLNLMPEGSNQALSGANASFIQRMTAAIEMETDNSARRWPWLQLGPGLVGGAIAAVLTLAALVGLGLLGPDGERIEESSMAAAPGTTPRAQDTSQWLPEMPDEQRALLADLSGFYDNRAGWIATTGNDTQIGLSAEPVASGKPLVTRLSLASPSGDVLTTDLALFAGQDVVILAPRSGRPPVRYAVRLHRDVDGDGTSLAIAAEFAEGTSLSTTLRIQDIGVQEVGRIHTERGDYVLHLGLDHSRVHGAI